MAGELERVHSRIDEVAKDVNSIKVSVATIATTIQMTPRHEEGKCKPFVEHVEHHDKETCSTLREHIAKESASTEKKNYFLADVAVRLIIPLLSAIAAGGVAWYLHP